MTAYRVAEDKHYVHNQGVPATVWVIPHNLFKHPAVDVVDSAGTVVYGRIQHVSTILCTVTFSAAFGGKAYCN